MLLLEKRTYAQYLDGRVKTVIQKTCGEIEKDIPRTFPDVPGFNDPAGQRRLMRILRSYAALDPDHPVALAPHCDPAAA